MISRLYWACLFSPNGNKRRWFCSVAFRRRDQRKQTELSCVLQSEIVRVRESDDMRWQIMGARLGGKQVWGGSKDGWSLGGMLSGPCHVTPTVFIKVTENHKFVTVFRGLRTVERGWSFMSGFGPRLNQEEHLDTRAQKAAEQSE